MPHYPSNFNNPSAILNPDNVASFIEFKDLINSSVVAGEYPSYRGLGNTVETNPTQTIPDLITMAGNLSTQLTNLVTALNAISGATELRYASDMLSLKFNQIQRQSLDLARSVYHLTGHVNTLVANGVPAVSVYPTDQPFG